MYMSISEQQSSNPGTASSGKATYMLEDKSDLCFSKYMGLISKGAGGTRIPFLDQKLAESPDSASSRRQLLLFAVSSKWGTV
ncbi:hypothetical protein AAFF_G00107350 [Aldrovandia affinis]|uniref:Uncharacterized protein n=1 Tax=Aldrovandia affinis TaxID=143900 RepID=A0AAD7WAV1_9TELE|nr:hypothetical protein AAFF_G00107350 [Aldrovandia affinis]